MKSVNSQQDSIALQLTALKIGDPLALEVLVEKCKDQRFTILEGPWGDSMGRLKAMNLVEDDGSVRQAVREIVLKEKKCA